MACTINGMLNLQRLTLVGLSVALSAQLITCSRTLGLHATLGLLLVGLTVSHLIPARTRQNTAFHMLLVLLILPITLYTLFTVSLRSHNPLAEALDLTLMVILLR